MSFLPPVVGCLLKKAYKGGSQAPGAPPSYASESTVAHIAEACPWLVSAVKHLPLSNLLLSLGGMLLHFLLGCLHNGFLATTFYKISLSGVLYSLVSI